MTTTPLRAFAAIIFDNDGVLVDSEPLSLIAYRAALAEQDVHLTPADDDEYCGLTDADIITQLAARVNQPLDGPRFTARKAELYKDLMRERGLHAMPGAHRVLGTLRARRIPFALASSGSRQKVTANLCAAGLNEFFDLTAPGAAISNTESAAPARASVITGDCISRGKPDPEIFLRAADALGVSPADCAVIEDSLNGLRAARAAGSLPLALATTFPPDILRPHADAILATLEDLLPLLPNP